jgi:photosystem II stability/assembly factor-like uncharacterized protein
MKKIILLLLVLSVNIYSQFWVEQNSGVSVSLNSVTNSTWGGMGWICGNNGTVLRTSNLGTNWLNVSGNGIPNDVTLNVISDMSSGSDHAITAGKRGDTAIVYRTTNNGASWQVVFRQNGGKINGISVGNQFGFITGNPVGGRWSIWKSTNNGLNWDSSGFYIPENNGETGWNNSFMYTNSYIFFGTNNSRLYFSSNSGSNWSHVATPGLSNIVSLDMYSFQPSQFGGYLGGLNKILWTSNNGANWTVDTTMPGSGNITGMHKQPLPVDALGQNSLIAVKNNNKIYWQFAYSSTWTDHFTAPSGNYTHVATKLYTNVWAVRDNGGISYCSCIISGITYNQGSTPQIFSLYQNYPNPFNPVTNIKFDMPKSGLVKLVIYDAAGKEITHLVNQQMQGGSYSTDWDASVYPSGVYFYKIEANDFSETKKMVLIK